MQRTYKLFEIGVKADREVEVTDPVTGQVVTAVISGAEKTPVCEKIATSLTDTQIISAIKAANYPWKKGMQTYADVKQEMKYVLSDDEFLAHATLVEE